MGYTSLQQLEGPSANYVWRAIDPDGKSTILKHAEPYVAASGGRMPFSVERMDFEFAALMSLPQHIPESPQVATPKVYWYDGENHVLMVEDGGPRHLKAAYTNQSVDMPKIGTALGVWLAGLHSSMKAVDIGDNKAAKGMYRFSYSNLADVLQKYGHDPALGKTIDEQYGSLLQTDDDCICHGDMWPGNVLIDGDKCTVVDWEMVRRGCGATDVGQFAAEAYLLDRFHGGRGLLPAFLLGYRGNTKLDERFLQRVAVHMGVHLAFWPTRVSWGTENETRECVEVGKKLMTQATDNEDGWMRGSILDELL